MNDLVGEVGVAAVRKHKVSNVPAVCLKGSVRSGDSGVGGIGELYIGPISLHNREGVPGSIVGEGHSIIRYDIPDIEV